jgi:hypothetical protein
MVSASVGCYSQQTKDIQTPEGGFYGRYSNILVPFNASLHTDYCCTRETTGVHTFVIPILQELSPNMSFVYTSKYPIITMENLESSTASFHSTSHPNKDKLKLNLTWL